MWITYIKDAALQANPISIFMWIKYIKDIAFPDLGWTVSAVI